MPSFNSCQFVGNAARDCEVRYTANGMAVANVSIAVNYKANGEEMVEWVNLVFWDKVAEIAGKYVTKGKPIFVQGRLQTRKWKDKEGVERYSTEIVVNQLQLLGGKDDDEGGGRSQGRGRDDDRGRGRDEDRGRGDGRGNGSSSAPPARAAAPSQAPRRQSAPTTGTGFDDLEDDVPFISSCESFDLATAAQRKMKRYRNVR